MAETIRGINVVVGADTTALSKALSDVNKRSRDIQSELKQVERLLKLDPSNTELLAQKQKLLADAVENAREKLDRLRAAQEQVNEQFQRGEISEGQYRAFQREVVKTEQELAKLEKQLKDMEPAVKSIGERMKEAGEKMKKAGENMSEAGEKLSKFVTAPLAAAGAGLVAVGAQFDDAFDKIRIGTGATGEALDGLLEDFRAVVREVPASFDDISTAIADYNTRLGLSGEALRELSAQTLELARITGGDLSKTIEETSQVFQAFNLPAEQYSEALDLIFRVSQSTGIGIERLEANMVRFAPAIKQLGIDFQSAATLLGQLDKAGVDVEQTLAGLTRAVASLAKEGITDANEAIQTLFDEIRNAPSDLEGTQRALEVFGTRAGPALASAIREGKLEYQDLLRELSRSDETILGVAEDTKDWSERLVELKNALLLALEPLAERFFGAINDLIPVLQKFVGQITDLVEWFVNLPDGVQNTIIAIGGLLAAIGPLLVVIGKLTSGVGSIIAMFGKLAAAAAPAAAGTAAAGTAAGAASVGFWSLLGPIALIVAGLAAVAAGGYALYRHLQKEAIPEIERFGDEVSEATQQAVGAFMDLNDKATVELNELAWSGQTVTQEMADSIVSTFDQMGQQVLEAMEKRHAEELESMQAFFANAQGLTEEEQAEILAKVQEGQDLQRQAVEEGQARIEEILRAASEQKRGLTKEEADEIRRIQQKMLETGIEMMSENELEQRAILERMRANASALSARQAAEVVQNSIKQRDESIAAAEKQYNDVVKNIIRQRDELGTITAEQADKLIAEAQRQRDETIARAQEMHQAVVAEAQKQAQEHVNKVNWETGEIKTRWQVLKDTVWTRLTEMQNSVDNAFLNMWNAIKQKMADIGTAIKDKFNEIMAWLKGLPSQFMQLGKDMIQGLVDGIKNMIGSVGDTVKNVADKVTGGLKDFLGISSPSRVLMQLGEYTGEGFALGLERTINAVRREAAEMAAAVTGGLSGLSVPGVAVSGGGVAAPSTINMDGLFAGATIVVRNDDDIRQLAREIWSMAQQAQRGLGGARA